jgi:hypothetical protein
MYRLDTSFFSELGQDWLASIIFLNVCHYWYPLPMNVPFNVGGSEEKSMGMKKGD